MEQKKALISRKNEARSLFKKCFKNKLFSLVPFEIWRDLIVSNAELKTIVVLSQTCHAFKEIVDIIGENNLNLALLLRREGQIVLARKYLQSSANNGNVTAMYHLGFAHSWGGWGIRGRDVRQGAQFFKKSAEGGHGISMAYYSSFLSSGSSIQKDVELSKVWAQKALASNNHCAIGFCWYNGLGTDYIQEKAVPYFEKSAEEGDELGEYLLGYYFSHKDNEKSFFWYLKSAEHGLSISQNTVARMYRDGQGCVKDEGKAIFWYKKAAAQGCEQSEVFWRKLLNDKK